MFLSQALSFTATPLTDDQAERVVQALTEQGTPAMPTDSPFAVLNSDLGVVKLSDQGRAQVKSILSSSQQHVLDDKIKQQVQLLEARSRIGHPEK